MNEPALHWAFQYIGTPWEAGAQGPGAFDCWAFFRHVQREHFGIEVPIVQATDYDDADEIVALVNGHEENQRWWPIHPDVPLQDGDGVVIHRPLHVGVWLSVDGGGVLHCARNAGVIFTKDWDWPHSGFGRREFRRFGVPLPE